MIAKLEFESTLFASPCTTAEPLSLSVNVAGVAEPPWLLVTSLTSVIEPLFVFVKVQVTVSLSSTIYVAIPVLILPELFSVPSSSHTILVRSHPGSASSSVVYVPGNTFFSIVLPSVNGPERSPTKSNTVGSFKGSVIFFTMIVPLGTLVNVHVTLSPTSILISEIVLVPRFSTPDSLSHVMLASFHPGSNTVSVIFQTSSGITDMNPVESIKSPGSITRSSGLTRTGPSNIKNLNSVVSSTTPVNLTILRNASPAFVTVHVRNSPSSTWNVSPRSDGHPVPVIDTKK